LWWTNGSQPKDTAMAAPAITLEAIKPSPDEKRRTLNLTTVARKWRCATAAGVAPVRPLISRTRQDLSSGPSPVH
jgi:hypothetical protein